MDDHGGAVFAAAGAAEDDFDGQDDLVAGEGQFASGDAIEEQVGCDAAHLLGWLADNGERGGCALGHVEVVKAGEGHVGGHLDAKVYEGAENVACGEVVGGEDGGGRVGSAEHAFDCAEGVFLRLAAEERGFFQTGILNGTPVTHEAGVDGEQAAAEAHEGDAFVCVLDEVLGHAA